jgi:hypothetical protein
MKMQRATEDLVHHMTNYATATAALNTWCAERLHPHDSRITASVLVDESVPVDTYKGILAIQASELLRYRRVVLKWGHTAVSEAENWYLPDRLPRLMRWQMRTVISRSDKSYIHSSHDAQLSSATPTTIWSLSRAATRRGSMLRKPFQSFHPFKISSCTSEQS